MSDKKSTQNPLSNKPVWFVIIAASSAVIIIVVTTFVLGNPIMERSNKSTVTNQTTVSSDTETVQGRLISGFPEFLEYPGSIVISSSKDITEGDETIYKAILEVPSVGSGEIIDWYESGLGAMGYVDVTGHKSGVTAKRGPFTYKYVVESRDDTSLVNLEIIFDLTKTEQDDD